MASLIFIVFYCFVSALYFEVMSQIFICVKLFIILICIICFISLKFPLTLSRKSRNTPAFLKEKKSMKIKDAIKASYNKLLYE
ncbi:unnamed protein product [Acanthoscelides obtectus]|uniref:Uncharacterized protein n=1 Tax=Acanthoscelides obtectus TaxID=200917 RepID=A0A9P0NWW8_ACAOB|nr:unnamed protein product [Acanthoscelides obtectus]CAK1647023.1 hypothetical protein AOBTE_LOCUS15008 [Acanthoscelides obtectus]